MSGITSPYFCHASVHIYFEKSNYLFTYISTGKWKKPSLLNKFCKSKVKKGRYKFNLQIRDPAPAPSYDPAGDSIMDTEDHDSIEDTESNVEPKR